MHSNYNVNKRHDANEDGSEAKRGGEVGDGRGPRGRLIETPSWNDHCLPDWEGNNTGNVGDKQ